MKYHSFFFEEIYILLGLVGRACQYYKWGRKLQKTNVSTNIFRVFIIFLSWIFNVHSLQIFLFFTMSIYHRFLLLNYYIQEPWIESIKESNHYIIIHFVLAWLSRSPVFPKIMKKSTSSIFQPPKERLKLFTSKWYTSLKYSTENLGYRFILRHVFITGVANFGYLTMLVTNIHHILQTSWNHALFWTLFLCDSVQYNPLEARKSWVVNCRCDLNSALHVYK